MKTDYSKWATPCLVRHFFAQLPTRELNMFYRVSVYDRIARHNGDMNEKVNGTRLAYWVKHLLTYFLDVSPSEPLRFLMAELRKRMTEYEEQYGEVAF